MMFISGCRSDPEKTNLGESLDNTQSLSQLDILQDYDRDLWGGPDAWNEEQWRWKRLLKWDRNCDYVGDVETYDLNERLQLVKVQCVPGAYQAMYYLFLFDKTTQESKQLKLGHPESTDNPKEIFGEIEYDKAKQQMSILTLSRGVGDCGRYRLFNFISSDNLHKVVFQEAEMRKRGCTEYSVESLEEVPRSIFDYKNWPLVK
jgi:hypothetical protein